MSDPRLSIGVVVVHDEWKQGLAEALPHDRILGFVALPSHRPCSGSCRADRPQPLRQPGGPLF